VGPDVHLAADVFNAKQMHERYSETPEYLAMLRGALHYMKVERIDLLVIGLPVTAFKAKKSAALEKLVLGRHDVSRGKTVSSGALLLGCYHAVLAVQGDVRGPHLRHIAHCLLADDNQADVSSNIETSVARSLIDIITLDSRIEEEISKCGTLKDFHIVVWLQEPDADGCNWNARVDRVLGDGSSDSS
jgi:hypothetical protein